MADSDTGTEDRGFDYVEDAGQMAEDFAPEPAVRNELLFAGVPGDAVTDGKELRDSAVCRSGQSRLTAINKVRCVAG